MVNCKRGYLGTSEQYKLRNLTYRKRRCKNKMAFDFLQEIKMKLTKKTCSLFLMMSWINVQAVPWCHNGTIVQIADVSWNESSIEANYPGTLPDSIPDWVVGNVNMHIAFVSTNHYASTFIGGGGGFGDYTVSNSGDVRVEAYGPHNYITAPSLYHISQGVQFKIKKCYTVPPMTAVKERFQFSPDIIGPEIIDVNGSGGAIKVKALDGLEQIQQYWLKSRQGSN